MATRRPSGYLRTSSFHSPQDDHSMTENLNRRSFLTAGAALGLGATAMGAFPQKGVGNKGPMAISSANGLAAVTRAMELMKAGSDPLDAAIEGVAIVEADESDHTVGKGGIPNE